MDMECVVKEKFEEYTEGADRYNRACRDVEAALLQIVGEHPYCRAYHPCRGSNREGKVKKPIAAYIIVYVVQIEGHGEEIAGHENSR